LGSRLRVTQVFTCSFSRGQHWHTRRCVVCSVRCVLQWVLQCVLQSTSGDTSIHLPLLSWSALAYSQVCGVFCAVCVAMCVAVCCNWFWVTFILICSFSRGSLWHICGCVVCCFTVCVAARVNACVAVCVACVLQCVDDVSIHLLVLTWAALEYAV